MELSVIIALLLMIWNMILVTNNALDNEECREMFSGPEQKEMVSRQ